jgi:hypothetical protein
MSRDELTTRGDGDYQAWVRDLKDRYRQSQLAAAVSVNRELLVFYWTLGRDITTLQAESRWGSDFYNTLSQDLQREIPNVKGFSPRNLRYMKRFYRLFPNASNFLPQPVAKSPADESSPRRGAARELPRLHANHRGDRARAAGVEARAAWCRDDGPPGAGRDPPPRHLSLPARLLGRIER